MSQDGVPGAKNSGVQPGHLTAMFYHLHPLWFGPAVILRRVTARGICGTA